MFEMAKRVSKGKNFIDDFDEFFIMPDKIKII